MKIVSLASGSRGNACFVLVGTDALLIDAGLPYRTLQARLKAAGLDLGALRLHGVLITHDHGDHVGGLATFVRHHPVVVYANSMTAEAIAVQTKMADDAFACFENGQDFDVGPFSVHPFSIPHDTVDPVGYLVRTRDGETYFHGTDIGSPLDSIGMQLREATVATLESNHDAVMLRTSMRPPALIQRIAGPRGHLSNDQACEFAARFASPRLTRLALAHLSHDCNEPTLASRTMRAALDKSGRSDVKLSVLSQDEVFAW